MATQTHNDVRGGWSRADALTMAVAAALTWITRGLLRGRDLYSWDSGLLAAGIVEFDFLHAQPHAPFYPLTIALGKVLAPWTGPAMALVWLSVFASGIMVAATFGVARRFLSRPGAVLAAFVAFAAPVSLFNGITSLSYSLEGAASVVVAAAALRVRDQPGVARAVVLAILVSVAIGIRPSSAFFLSPVALWALWGRWRELGWGIGAGGAATAAWVVPALVAGGGWAAFAAVNAYQSSVFILHDPVWVAGLPSVVDKAAQLAAYIPHEMPFLVAVGMLGAVTSATWRPRGGTAFWLAWALPPLLFFLFVYVGWPIFPTGYVMVLVPAAAVGSAAALEHAWKAIQNAEAPARAAGALVIAFVAIQPAAWLADWDEAAQPMREAEAWSRSWDDLDAIFPSNSTAILTFYGWHWAKMHHPDHLTWIAQPWEQTDHGGIQVEVSRHGSDRYGFYANILDGPDDPLHPIPAWVERIVLLEGHPHTGYEDLVKPSIALYEATLPSGRVVRYFEPAGLLHIEAAFPWTDEAGVP